MERACPHPFPVEDMHEGTLVCTHCGLVLEDHLFESPPAHPPIPSLPPEPLPELCHRLHIPLTLIQDKIKYIPPKSNQDVPRAMVGALYQALLQAGAPRSLHHLCEPLGLSPTEVWPYSQDVASCLPSQVVEHTLSPLNLPYGHVSAIREWIQTHYDHAPFAPRTVVSTAAYLYLKETPYRQSLSTLAKTLGVSVMSIHRCKGRLQHHDVSPRS